MRAKNRKNNCGLSLTEYVVLLGIVIGAITLSLGYVKKTIQGGVASMTDNFVGIDQDNHDFAYNLSAGKGFVDQAGAYEVSGDTSTSSTINVTEKEFGDGSSTLKVEGMKTEKSPGENALGITALPEYTFTDPAKKPNYLPSVVSADEGYVEPPGMEEN